MTDVLKESVTGLKNGVVFVGTSATPLSNSSAKLFKGLLLRCPGPDEDVPNSSPVYVGGDGVTADLAETGGVPVLPGDSIFIPLESLAGVYVVAVDEDQSVAWLAI